MTIEQAIEQYENSERMNKELAEKSVYPTAKANPEYFKDLFGYYYDDVQDIRKKIAEAGE